MKKTLNKSMLIKATTLSALLGTLIVVGTSMASDAPKSLNEDPISLAQAIEIAKKATGGIVVEAEREMERGQAIYEIELQNEAGAEIKTVVKATTGEVILNKTRREDDDDKDHRGGRYDDDLEDALWLSGLKEGTYLSLEQALAQAENQVGGQAWSIELEDDHDELYYEVELLDAQGKQVELRIDALVAR